MLKNDPIIIIGAPRSGTNMLRNCLCRVDGFETWPCDEINYIWRHGNRDYPNDAIPPELATEQVKSFITKKFEQIEIKTSARRIVEKTCANSLRVPFVNAVLPNAKYVFIVRNGVDAVASATKKRSSKLNVPYVIEKLRYVPVVDLPFYFVRYAKDLFIKKINGRSGSKLWGPIPEVKSNFSEDLSPREQSVHQWKQCVVNSALALSLLPRDRVHLLRYEEFVANPCQEFSKILRFIGEEQPKNIDQILCDVSNANVGKGFDTAESEDPMLGIVLEDLYI